MFTGETIPQLFYQHQLTLPFAVRKGTWSREYYVIVEGLDVSRRLATGVPTKQGQLVRLFESHAGWRQEHSIPQANQRVWEYAPEVDLSAYQPARGEGRIYELHHRLFWGKYKGLSIEEICQEHLNYIEWAIEEIEKNFCLSEAAMARIAASGLELDPYIIELNQAKLIWYAHELTEEYLPEQYAYLIDPDPNAPPLSEPEVAAMRESIITFLEEQDRLGAAGSGSTAPPEQ